MILANVSAAKTLNKNQAEALYRIHDEPDSDRLGSFLSYLGEVGISHHIGSDVSPQDFTDVIEKIQGRADQELIQTMLLRSMKQAVYECENIGHFGLALEAYAHFTSPIRRYPDLVVHRALKGIIDKQNQRKNKSGGKAYTADEVQSLGEQCSMTERRADDATRDVSDWLKCEFMLDHVGDVFAGVIASVTNFGFFVRLTEFHIDGLVHITTLEKDYFRYDEVKQHLIGENSGKIYRLGDPVEVKVAAVNLDERKIDFVLDGVEGKNIRKSAGKKKPARAKKPKHKVEAAVATVADKPAPKSKSTKKPTTRKSRTSSKSKSARSKPTTSSRKGK
jgi:ribonuclease R